MASTSPSRRGHMKLLASISQSRLGHMKLMASIPQSRRDHMKFFGPILQGLLSDMIFFAGSCTTQLDQNKKSKRKPEKGKVLAPPPNPRRSRGRSKGRKIDLLPTPTRTSIKPQDFLSPTPPIEPPHLANCANGISASFQLLRYSPNFRRILDHLHTARIRN